MKPIRIPKGYDLNLGGRPSADIDTLPEPSRVAILPEHMPFVKPRLLTAVGQSVQVRTPLIDDKRNPSVRFLSPGAGRQLLPVWHGAVAGDGAARLEAARTKNATGSHR